MSEVIRSEVVTVKSWEEENKKIYLFTNSGKKYRYVGKHDLHQIRKMFPNNKALVVRPVYNGTTEILFDESIISC